MCPKRFAPRTADTRCAEAARWPSPSGTPPRYAVRGRYPANRACISLSIASGVMCVIPVPAKKSFHQKRNILFPLAQGRNADLDDIQPVEQILPERAALHFAREIPMGGGDDPDIHLLAMQRTRPGRYSRSCSSRRSLTCRSSGRSPISSKNAVPPLAISISPFLFSGRAGERALDVAEEFAFHQRADQRSAIDGNERAAPRGIVQAPARSPPYRCRFRPAAEPALCEVSSCSILRADLTDLPATARPGRAEYRSGEMPFRSIWLIGRKGESE